MLCIAHLRATYEPYVAHWFTKEAFLKCYSCIIDPLPDKSKWPHIETNEILPPNVHRPPGKPKTCKRMEHAEKPSHKRKFSISCTHYRGI